jgi:hypothetical protein
MFRAVSSGNFTVLEADFFGQKKNIIFCYLPGQPGIVNGDFLNVFGAHMCSGALVRSACP